MREVDMFVHMALVSLLLVLLASRSATGETHEGQGQGEGNSPDVDLDYLSDFVNTNAKIGTGSSGRKTATKMDRRVKASKKMPLFLDDDEMMSNHSGEYRIKRRIMRYYDKMTRPVINDTSVTSVVVGMSLFHILDTNEKFQTLSALIAIRLQWVDEYLRWEPELYNNVKQIWIPADQIWRPDIFINNFADESFKDFTDTYAIVDYTGHTLWMFPAVIKTYCTFDVRHFPFDQQKCDVVFISWTFSGAKLDLLSENASSSIYYKPKNQEWLVDNVTVIRNEKVYACCPDPYPDVTFTIHMTRRSLFYVLNLIFPCLLIYAVAFLGFFLPVESGEKVNLETTILLALVVFLLIMGETLPPTPDAIPALGALFAMTMIMVSIALVMAVIVTNIYLRKDGRKPVPHLLHTIFLRHTCTACPKTLCPAGRDTSTPFPLPVTLTVTSSLDNHVNGSTKHTLRGDGVGTLSVPEIEMDSLSILSELEAFNAVSQKCQNCRTALHNMMTSSTATSAAYHSSTGNGKRRQSSVYSAREGGDCNCCSAHAQKSSYELELEAEWRRLAKVVDRVCFWIFLVSSITLLGALFGTIPSYSIIAD